MHSRDRIDYYHGKNIYYNLEGDLDNYDIKGDDDIEGYDDDDDIEGYNDDDVQGV